MKKIIVPKSLRKRAIINALKRLPKFLIIMWMVDCVVEYISLSIFYAAGNNMGNLSTVFVLLYSLPFLISGIPLKLIDSDWYGEIISIELTNEPKTNQAQKASITQTALIKMPNGRLKTHKIYDEGELFYGNRVKVYNVHDTVIHVYGMDYLTPIRTLRKDLPIVCVACGYKSSCETKICSHCGNSMEVHLEDTSNKKGN